ncbi:MAG: UDP-N-acetylglucosamine 1-carboxyvinyltransferase [Rhodobacteraceae bacterium]|nr:UDP-N-acetylglucosamine 1-carboxyvinyltransferase [Paracoccaceae bacterium]
MDSIIITGNGPLSGRIPISGAKNTCLKLMTAALLADEPLTLTNVPRLSDITTLRALLESLGCEVALLREGRVMVLSARQITSHRADYQIVRKLRASFNVLGPLLARTGEAIVSLPGGCAIGARRVDLHLMALERLGATITLEQGYVHARAAHGLSGAMIEFPLVSVGATENALMAATLAKGTTVIRNAAREPDTVDLAKCLGAMGAQIEGAGSAEITVHGVARLHGTTHEVIPDRIELGTFMIAPAIAGGEVELMGGKRALLEAFCQHLEEAGVEIAETHNSLRVRRRGNRVRAVDVTTAPFPGFPTDLQAQFMALMCTAEGTSVMEETIFENRFMHAPELIRMGARIDVRGGTATVTGVPRLTGAPVMATDLRASVSLIMAGLAAEGETCVARVYHLDRGYEQIEQKLLAVGARIERVKGGVAGTSRFPR